MGRRSILGVVLLVCIAVAAACAPPAEIPSGPLTWADPQFNANPLPDGVTLVTSRFLKRTDSWDNHGVQQNEYTDSAFLRGTSDATASRWGHWGGLVSESCGSGCSLRNFSPDGRYAFKTEGSHASTIVDTATGVDVVTLARSYGGGLYNMTWRQDSTAVILPSETITEEVAVEVTPGAVPEVLPLGTADCAPNYDQSVLSWSTDDVVLHSCVVNPNASQPYFLLLATPAGGGPTQELLRTNRKVDSVSNFGWVTIQASFVPGMPDWYVVAEPMSEPYTCDGLNIGGQRHYPTRLVLKDLAGTAAHVIAEPFHGGDCNPYYAVDEIDGWMVAEP